MKHLLYVCGALMFAFQSGRLILNNITDFRRPKAVMYLEGFFIGLFFIIFLDFLYLNYFVNLFSFNFFKVQELFFSAYLILSIAYYLQNSTTSFSGIRLFLENLSLKRLILTTLTVIAGLALSSLYVFENDALEYYGISRQLLFENSLEGYPPIHSKWSNPLYAPSTHPPYFHIFLAVFAPSTSSFIALRFILLAMSIGIIFLLLKPSEYLYGITIFLSVPILVFGIQGLSIESFRLPLFSGGLLLLLWEESSKLKLKSFIRQSIAFAMITAPHSLGLLLALLTLTSLYVVNHSPRRSLFQVLAFLFSILVFTPQYFINLIRFGSPVQDSTPVLDNTAIAFYTDLRIRRELDSTYGIFLNGALRPFVDFGLFGFVFLIGCVLSVIFLFKQRSNLKELQLQSICSLVILMFMALQVVSAYFGFELLIKNVRYALSIFPCLLVVIAHELGKKKNV